MKNNIENFVDEFTTNFSELFVETFFIRYLSEFDKNNLLEAITNLQVILNQKIQNKILIKLKSLELKDTN